MLKLPGVHPTRELDSTMWKPTKKENEMEAPCALMAIKHMHGLDNKGGQFSWCVTCYDPQPREIS